MADYKFELELHVEKKKKDFFIVVTKSWMATCILSKESECYDVFVGQPNLGGFHYLTLSKKEDILKLHESLKGEDIVYILA